MVGRYVIVGRLYRAVMAALSCNQQMTRPFISSSPALRPLLTQPLMILKNVLSPRPFVLEITARRLAAVRSDSAHVCNPLVAHKRETYRTPAEHPQLFIWASSWLSGSVVNQMKFLVFGAHRTHDLYLGPCPRQFRHDVSCVSVMLRA